MGKLMQWDVTCEVCGKQETAFFKEDEPAGSEDGMPLCCDVAMIKRVGGRYHQDFIDRAREKRDPNLNFKPDPLTEACVNEGLRRRKERLGGTGMY